MRLIAWFQLVMGAGILGIWPVLLVAGEVPEVAAGQRDIWFHIAAEAVAGALLLAAGWALLRRGGVRARLLSAFALGGLLYTGVNSAGHYAQLGELVPMALLTAFGCLAAWAFVVLWRRADAGVDDAGPPGREVRGIQRGGVPEGRHGAPPGGHGAPDGGHGRPGSYRPASR